MAKNLKLAKRAAALYRDDPGLTVDRLAAALEIGHAEAAELVDEHTVAPGGKVAHAGPGAGGGWASAGG